MVLNFIYITCSNRAEADKIGRALVEEHLAACVNIIDGMNSIYWWEGKIEEGKETVLIAKTKETVVKKLIEKVKSLHSYSCPCIVSLAVEDGNSDFLKWIEKETL
ncbi:MAG: divalent-cation tolerance protein CutA [Deltaproteobacteria bacterium]|nr:divalent-cation tolerance protein CutA [Deltaproteobacteria bacterium]